MNNKHVLRVLAPLAAILMLQQQEACATEEGEAKLQALNLAVKAAYGQRDWARALSLFEQIVPLLRAKYGNDSEEVGMALRNNGILLGTLGKKEE